MSSELPKREALAVVLVSYNTSTLLLGMLERLSAADWIVPIVIDNASADGSADAVAATFPVVELVRNTENLGFSRAANQGIARASSQHIALVNPDTDVSAALLADLSDYLDQHQNVWAVAPRLVDENGKAQTLAAGFRPTAARGILYFFGLSYILPWPDAGFSVPPGTDQPIDVDWLSGACLVFKREVLDRVGPLDESYFLYGEDMDWCRRMKAAGGRLTLLADHDLRHLQGASSGHEIVSTDWLKALTRYVLASTSRSGARLFFLAAAGGFLLRGVRSALPGFRTRRSLFSYSRAALAIAISPLAGTRQGAGAESRSN